MCVCVRQAADRQAERGGKVELFQKFPRRASILHMPLVTTLYYSCFYHYGEAEVSLAPPTDGHAPKTQVPSSDWLLSLLRREPSAAPPTSGRPSR